MYKYCIVQWVVSINYFFNPNNPWIIFSPHRISFYERVFFKAVKNQKIEFEELKVPNWMNALNESTSDDLTKENSSLRK